MELLIKDVVRLFNVPENTVYRWIEEKSLPACRVKGRFRFNKSELFEWATRSGITITTEFVGALSQPSQAMPGVAEALEKGGIFYGIKGEDKGTVLKSVVETIPLPPGLDRVLLLQVLLAREALGSTGLGNGIAIPHPRNPIVLNVDEPRLSLLFLEKPVDFEAVDQQPVHTLLTLISPTVRTHLHLLSKIAFVLHNQAFREMLVNRAGKERILEEVKRIETPLSGAE
jgi:nitrogen PTS system EIIA component